ncbi:NADP-reducing hydrogenase subunit HndA [bacterium BMS3Abin14]|nr:NADP-reducing hydrogenase subunit HndA [bacterium BMS3Abin14]
MSADVTEVTPEGVRVDAGTEEVEEELDLAHVREILGSLNDARGMLIPVLQGVQTAYGYVPEEAANLVADELGLYRSQVYGVLTFYTQFHLTPRGRHIIRACSGTACHVRGAKGIIDRLESILDVGHGETTEDRFASFEKVACLGCCGLAPVIMIDDDALGHLTPPKVDKIIKNLREMDGTKGGE